MKRLLLATLVFLAAACADRSATQYVGTVMRDAAPQAEGSLRLTLFSRTDTSFSGAIELGAPARGTGSAYVWYEGPELHMVTVGAESADTIHWTSRLTDAELGGRFEITGGDRAGEQGTWRAHLVRGPPATQATLRSPSLTPLPPPTAFWPVLLLLAAGVGLGRWIRRVPRAPLSADGSPWRAPPSQLAGVGGWLALFAVGQGLAALFWFVRVRSSWGQYVGSIGIGAAVPGMQPLIVLETTMFMVALPIALGGLLLLVRRSRYAPRYWFAYLAISGVYLLADVAAMHFLHPRLDRLADAGAIAGTESTRATQQQLRQLAFTFVWLLYWVRSRRVRATFGAAALDRTVIASAPAAVLAPDALSPSPPVRDRRWWGRIALRSIGIVFAAIVALLALGLWSTRTSPYAVPAGADIRKTVEGRWTWATDTAGCRHAHTIAFADGGKVMTISSGEISASDGVTTYDVLSTTRSMIRGAIRGERRMTDEGNPVVWDLVLTGPDEYRWKRTDWPSTPWSYTGRIRRCPAPQAATAGAR